MRSLPVFIVAFAASAAQAQVPVPPSRVPLHVVDEATGDAIPGETIVLGTESYYWAGFHGSGTGLLSRRDGHSELPGWEGEPRASCGDGQCHALEQRYAPRGALRISPGLLREPERVGGLGGVREMGEQGESRGTLGESRIAEARPGKHPQDGAVDGRARAAPAPPLPRGEIALVELPRGGKGPRPAPADGDHGGSQRHREERVREEIRRLRFAGMGRRRSEGFLRRRWTRPRRVHAAHAHGEDDGLQGRAVPARQRRKSRRADRARRVLGAGPRAIEGA